MESMTPLAPHDPNMGALALRGAGRDVNVRQQTLNGMQALFAASRFVEARRRRRADADAKEASG
jgi:hypothetical protein